MPREIPYPEGQLAVIEISCQFSKSSESFKNMMSVTGSGWSLAEPGPEPQEPFCIFSSALAGSSHSVEKCEMHGKVSFKELLGQNLLLIFGEIYH